MASVNLKAVDKATDALEREYIKSLQSAYQETLKNVDKEIRVAYSKYNVKGKFNLQAFQRMTKTEQGRLTRLEILEKQINTELASLSRGRPQQLSAYLTDVYGVNYTGTGNEVLRLANVQGSFEFINRKAVYESVRTPLTDIALDDLSDALKKAVRRDITSGIVQGDSIGKMAKRIKGTMETNANRAVTIARTETTRVMGTSRQQAFNEAHDMGVKLKKVWISTNDARTRDRHKALQGEERHYDKPFSNGMMYPGEPGAPAEEIVHCRCAMIAEVEERP